MRLNQDYLIKICSELREQYVKNTQLEARLENGNIEEEFLRNKLEEIKQKGKAQ